MDRHQVESLFRLQRELRDAAEAKGWTQCPHEPEAILARLALVTTEVSEAAEVLREVDSWSSYGGGRLELTEHGRDHFGEELADCVIRVLDLADSLDINLATAIFEKIERNKARPHKHGKVI